MVPIHDALGSTIGLVNSSGTLTQLIGYTPYGQPTNSAGQFTGQQWDSAANLIPFPARYYSPQLQRFLSEDPLGFGGGSTNLFQYANSSPVNYTDPLGLATTIGLTVSFVPLSASGANVVGQLIGAGIAGGLEYLGLSGWIEGLLIGAGVVAGSGLAAAVITGVALYGLILVVGNLGEDLFTGIRIPTSIQPLGLGGGGGLGTGLTTGLGVGPTEPTPEGPTAAGLPGGSYGGPLNFGLGGAASQ
ncbi:RHS repeat-associated core domain-containing protein [Candidatus Binatus sp.]|uniref:RHS repeat-associated core domain-containing protein n=1 Tax=Candidatus Binatus sp. TaxID=2811406 RepID=UPI003CC61EA2